MSCPSLSAQLCFAFYVFSKCSIVKNSDFLAGIHFNFLRKRPGLNLKVICYQILNCEKIGNLVIK